MDSIRFQIVQQTLIVGDHHCTGLRRLQLIETVSNNTQSVHIKTGIRFVENGKSRFQHSHLKDFITLLFTTTETFIHAAIGKFVIQFYDSTLLAHQLQEFAGRECRQMAILALFVDSSTHKVHHRDAQYLHRCLK